MKFTWILSAILMLQAVAVQAEEGNPYLVRSLSVESKVFDPLHSRPTALKQATLEGFHRLLGQLTSPKEIEKHKEVLEQVNLNILLKKVHIESERTDVPYQVTFDLEYDRDAVKDLLTDLKIPFSEVSTGRVLLIPLFETDGETYLWQENNPWRTSLTEASLKLGLVNFILPSGDMNEMRMLTPEMAAFGAEDILLSVGEGYNTDTVCVVRAKEAKTVVGRTFSVEATWYGKEHMEPIYQYQTIAEDQTLEQVMQDLAGKVLTNMEDNWRSLNMVSFDKTTSVLVRFSPKTLTEAERLRSTFAKLPVLKDLWLRMMSQKEIIYQIDFYGDVSKLLQQVEALGVRLKETEVGAEVWVAELK